MLILAGNFSISLETKVATSRTMASRPLTSLALPARLLGKLTAVGYTTVSELRDLDADSLANGLWLPAIRTQNDAFLIFAFVYRTQATH